MFFITPIAKGRPRMTRRGHCYTPEKTKTFENLLRYEARAQYPYVPLEGALQIVVHFFLPKPKSCKRAFPTVKPDTDNLLKAVCDALNGVIWKDDAQIVDMRAVKHYALGRPSIQLRVQCIT